MKNQVSSLESELVAMNTELEQLRSEAKAAAVARSYPTPRTSLSNNPPTRSETATPAAASRNATLPSDGYSDSMSAWQTPPGASTPTGQPTPELEGTWGSMHAPKYGDFVPPTPRPRHATVQRWVPPVAKASGASPTMTSVSLAPTQQDDGWWA